MCEHVPLEVTSFFAGVVREGVKKNCEKAVRLTAWVDPPPPKRSEKCKKFLDILSYLGLFCHFIMDKMGQNFHKIEAVRLEGGDPPPAVSLTAFSRFFFDDFP